MFLIKRNIIYILSIILLSFSSMETCLFKNRFIVEIVNIIKHISVVCDRLGRCLIFARGFNFVRNIFENYINRKNRFYFLYSSRNRTNKINTRMYMIRMFFGMVNGLKTVIFEGAKRSSKTRRSGFDDFSFRTSMVRRLSSMEII